MKRAIILVLDSLGLGGAPDAEAYGDHGACTLGHIVEHCAKGLCDGRGRSGPLHIPHLERLGLLHALQGASGISASTSATPSGAWGHARENSLGKDTPSGHLEMTGLPVLFEWATFPDENPALPAWLTEKIIAVGELPGILLNRHYSGTDAIDDFAQMHIETGMPIVYTSVDSVIQIAAHEQHFGLERLLELCQRVRRVVDEAGLKLGRVIARPFVGDASEGFVRSGNRHDYANPPPGKTLLDAVVANGGRVHAVGKIKDIFSGQGVTDYYKAHLNDSLFDATLEAISKAEDGSLVFTNFVEFDSEFGHRRDVAGYAACLEAFDARLPELLAQLQEGDLLMMSADHGNDPSWRGTDHTREQVPVLASGPNFAAVDLGARASFADIGQTVAEHLNCQPLVHGQSFYQRISSA